MSTNLLPILCFVVMFCTEIKTNNENDFYNEVKNSRDFTGKVVLITGSNSGIGLMTVKLFSALGASVVVTGRNTEAVQKAAEEVQALSPQKLKPLQVVADLTKQDDLEHLFNKTIDKFGKLDVLVNDAGTFYFGPIQDPDFMEKFDQDINFDLKPALQLIRLAIPFLSRTKGSIVNVVTILTQVPQKYLLSHTVAKEGLKMATEVLSQELGPLGIRINSISPGAIESHGPNNMSESIAKTTPLGRMGQPEDISRGIVFLASSDAKFITGANIDVDGGLKHSIGGNFVSGGK